MTPLDRAESRQHGLAEGGRGFETLQATQLRKDDIGASIESLERVVQDWLSALPAGVDARMLTVEAAIGGGSTPGRSWPSVALAIAAPSPAKLQRALIAGATPVVGRMHDGQLLLDARTVAPAGQAAALLDSLRAALETL